MNALRVARAGGKGIDDQQVNAPLQQFTRLVDERPKGVLVGLVAGGHDLNHRDDSITAGVSHDDGTFLATVERRFGLDDHAGSRPRLQRGRRAAVGPLRQHARFLVRLIAAHLKGENIRAKPAGNLLGQRVIIGGKQPPIQGPGNLGNPFVMKRMKDSGRDSRPIVHRHDGSFGKTTTLGLY